MRFKLEMLLNKPRLAVWQALEDAGNLKKWQTTLVNIENISGTPGRVGSVTKLSYKAGEREYALLEKIIQRDEPNNLHASYENNFAENTLKNTFIEQGTDQTLWVLENEFKFKTLLMKVMGNVLKKNYVRRTQRDMQRFKEMLESE